MEDIKVSYRELKKSVKHSHVKQCLITINDRDENEYLIKLECEFIFKSSDGINISYNLFDNGKTISQFKENYSDFLSKIKENEEFFIQGAYEEDDFSIEISFNNCKLAIEKFQSLINEFLELIDIELNKKKKKKISPEKISPEKISPEKISAEKISPPSPRKLSPQKLTTQEMNVSSRRLTPTKLSPPSPKKLSPKKLTTQEINVSSSSPQKLSHCYDNCDTQCEVIERFHGRGGGSTSLVKDGDKTLVKKIIYDRRAHTWNFLPGFKEIYPTNKKLYDRIINFYQKMYELGFGPETHAIICGSNLELYMEYFPGKFTKDEIAENSKEITKMIKKLHKAGYVHGDLHANNLAKDKNGNIKLIDFDTMFTKDEWNDNILPHEWVNSRWGEYWAKTLNRFLKYEEEETFYNFN